jgi:hypothetical protein
MKKINNKKFINDWQVDTPEGFKDFNGIIETKPTDVYKVEFEDNTHIKCSSTHTFYNIDMKEILCKDLKEFDILSGVIPKTVKSIEKLPDKKFLYDLIDVDNDTSSYYTNDVLSHNCKFLGSTSTLIQAEVLEAVNTIDPIDTRYDGNMKVFEEPQKNRTYICGVDVAKGTGGDNSVCQVLDITEMPWKQVAVFANNTTDTFTFSEICVWIATHYNNAYLCIENNAEGNAVINEIWHHLEYEYVVDYGKDKKELGIRATTKTKSLALSNLKFMIENGELEILDSDTLYEVSKFIEVRPGIYRGESGEMDDRVAALYWACFFKTLQDYYDVEEIKRIASRKTAPDEGDEEHVREEDMPLGSYFPENDEDEFSVF